MSVKLAKGLLNNLFFQHPPFSRIEVASNSLSQIFQALVYVARAWHPPPRHRTVEQFVRHDALSSALLPAGGFWRLQPR